MVVVALGVVAGGLRVVTAGTAARDLPVVVTVAQDTTVVDRPGSPPRPAVTGERLVRGAVVITGSAGAAALDVDGRRVLLASTSSVEVPDGEQAVLRTGAVLVDHREGPAATLRVANLTLRTTGAGWVRVDRGYAVRVAVYSGAVRLRTATGRTLEVSRLRQVGTTGSSLPDVAAPLALVGDAWERMAAPGVVQADEQLRAYATALDTTLLGTAGAATARLAGFLTGTERCGGGPASEVVLPAGISAASGDGADQACALRQDGGSWGVVAGLLGASSSKVVGAVDAALALPPGTATAPPTLNPPTADSNRPTPSNGPRPTPRPTSTRTSTPGSPTSSPEPVASIVEGIEELTRTPSPAASPSASLLPAMIASLGPGLEAAADELDGSGDVRLGDLRLL